MHKWDRLRDERRDIIVVRHDPRAAHIGRRWHMEIVHVRVEGSRHRRDER